MKKPCAAAATLLFIVLLFGCSTEKPICIGLLSGTSGRTADAGISSRDAAQLAVEECNQRGGILGRKVHLLVKDDQDQPERSSHAMRQMIEEGAIAIIGPMTSQAALAVAPIADSHKVPLLSPTAAADPLSGKEDFFFRMAPSRRSYANHSARYLIQKAGVRRMAAIRDRSNSAYTERWIGAFQQAFQEMGGELIAVLGFSSQDGRSFLDIARELLRYNPEGILIVANSMDAAVLCQQIRKFDAHVIIALSDWAATERLLSFGGRAVEDVICVEGFDRQSENPHFLAFRKTFLERSRRDPGFTAINTYDAVQVVLTAMQACNDTQTLYNAILHTPRFEGLQADFAFDRFGDAQRQLIFISTVRNQKFIVLE